MGTVKDALRQQGKEQAGGARQPSTYAHAKTGVQIKKKPQRRGESGLLRVPIGGNQ